jgi:hypothetical protein
MRRRMLWIGCLCGAALSTAGCGTAANTCWFSRDEGGMRAFGGVQVDWQQLRENTAKPPPSSDDSVPAWVVLADMPLSLVGDVVTLPVTIPISIWWTLNPQADRPSPRPGNTSGSEAHGDPAPL